VVQEQRTAGLSPLPGGDRRHAEWSLLALVKGA
jgi:hypothetical protein